MGSSATTNPILIMLINMTIVFGVLILLGLMMVIIQKLDPTKKKSVKVEDVAPVAAAAAATPAVTSNNDEIIAAITGAVVAMGFSSDQIASIRPAVSQSWKLDGRIAGRM